LPRGHQTTVITSRWDLRDIEVAYRMFERSGDGMMCGIGWQRI
jgi:hypothetical protein